MPIEFACESCTKLLRVPDGTAGQSCQCPACAAILAIPDPTAIEMVEVEEKSVAERRLTVPCPRCRFRLRVDSQLIGTKGQCRNCKYIFLISTVPDEAGTAAEAQATGLVFSCPRCKQLFEGRDEMQGRKGKCHSCGEVFTISLRQDEKPETPTIKMQLPAGWRRGEAAPSTTPKLEARTPVQLACPACNGLMEVPATAAGRTTVCPHCQQMLQIPGTLQRPAPTINPQPSAPLKSAKRKRLSADPVRGSDPTTPLSRRRSQGDDRKGSFEEGKRQSNSQQNTVPQNDIWADIGDTREAPNPYVAFDSGSKQAASPDWESSNRRYSSLTFANAFKLAFERAFPACFTALVVYAIVGGASAAISYTSLFVLSWALSFGNIERDAGVWIFGGVLVVIGLICMAIGTAGLCMVCNGALHSMRKKQASADELFSTGGVFLPMLVFLFTATVLAALLSAVPQGVATLVGEQNAALILLAVFCVLPLSLAFGLGTSLAPIAIADGEGPFEAIITSFKIFLANPLTMIGVLVACSLGYLLATVFTCGLAGIALAGFPYYLLAACYHLAKR